MSRARTKVSEWWETSYDRERWLRPYPQRTRPDARMVARINGGKVYHVTRYRLAPLVRLVWRVDPECPLEVDAWHKDRGGIATVSRGGHWTIWGLHQVNGYGATFSEAKDACAERLLELGYRVVDEKGGAS